MDEAKFQKIEGTYGCGYWHVCDDHSCPCSPSSAVGQGFNIEVYESMKIQCVKDRENLDLDLDQLYKEREYRDCLRDLDLDLDNEEE